MGKSVKRGGKRVEKAFDDFGAVVGHDDDDKLVVHSATVSDADLTDCSLLVLRNLYVAHVAKLLLIAPTVDGTDVGEAWVAFQWASRLAVRHDVTLLTYAKRGAPRASEQLSGLSVVEWTEPPLLGRYERLNSMLKPGYVAFFARARAWIRQAQRAGEVFDVAHQALPVAMRYPTPLLGSGVPYVIGPVGGSLPTPPGFLADADTAPWFSRLRGLDQWRLHHDPLLRRTFSEAACVLGIAPYVREHLAGISLHRFEVLSETALEELPPLVSRSGRTGPVRLLFVGRLIRTKGVRDLVRALLHLPDCDVTLDIVGDGYEREPLTALVEGQGLSERVRLHGRLRRAEIDGLYRSADVFVFPSFREAGGNVVLEAMSFGLPLVVADVGGPGSATDDSCALRLRPSDPETYAADIAQAIRRLASDEPMRLLMGERARERAERTALWSHRVDAVSEIYEEVVQARR